MSTRHEAVVKFLRGCGRILADELEDEPIIAANFSAGMELAAQMVEVEIDMNNRMAQCLIDAVAKGKFQEDQAIAVLIDWKKNRTYKEEPESDDT